MYGRQTASTLKEIPFCKEGCYWGNGMLLKTTTGSDVFDKKDLQFTDDCLKPGFTSACMHEGSVIYASSYKGQSSVNGYPFGGIMCEQHRWKIITGLGVPCPPEFQELCSKDKQCYPDAQAKACQANKPDKLPKVDFKCKCDEDYCAKIWNN